MLNRDAKTYILHNNVQKRNNKLKRPHKSTNLQVFYDIFRRLVSNDSDTGYPGDTYD